MTIEYCVFFFLFPVCFYLPIKFLNSLETEIRLGPQQTLGTEMTLASPLPPHLIQNKNDVIQTNKDKKTWQISILSILVLESVIC